MDSDIEDEAEAARAKAEELILSLQGAQPYDADADEDYGFGVGELLGWKGMLLRWIDSDNPDIETYLNLNTFYGAVVLDGRLYVSVGNGESISTEDEDTIYRFFEQHEVV